MADVPQSSLIQDIQAASWLAATIVGFVTAWLAIMNFKNSIRERQLDLMWKKANAANDFVHDMHSNEYSSKAIDMLDWLYASRGSHGNPAVAWRAEYAEILSIISDPLGSRTDDDKRYILQCFDWFFYYIDRAEQNIVDGLFSFENVKYIFIPYYEKIAQNRDVYDRFMSDRRYVRAGRFWKRFDNDKFWV